MTSIEMEVFEHNVDIWNYCKRPPWWKFWKRQHHRRKKLPRGIVECVDCGYWMISNYDY